MRDANGFLIKCKYSEWMIVDAQDNFDDVCLYYPYYHNLKCYADERCAHYIPDIKEDKHEQKQKNGY